MYPLIRLDLLSKEGDTRICKECSIQSICSFPSESYQQSPANFTDYELTKVQRRRERYVKYLDGVYKPNGNNPYGPMTEIFNVDSLHRYRGSYAGGVGRSRTRMAPASSVRSFTVPHSIQGHSHDASIHLLVGSTFQKNYLASTRFFS